MKTKLLFCTKNGNLEQWTRLPFFPRNGEYFNVKDILKEDEIKTIKLSAKCWQGIRGLVKSVEYRHDNNDFFIEVAIWCEE